MHLIRSGSIEGFNDLIEELGSDPVHFLNLVAIDKAIFKNPNTYITYNKIAKLLMVSSAKLKQPLLGLLLVAKQNTSIFGISTQIMRLQPTVKDAIKNINDYLHIHAQGITTSMYIEGENARIEMHFDFYCPVGHENLLQMCIGHLHLFVSHLIENDLVAIACHFKQHLPVNTITNKLFNNEKLLFNENFNGVSFPAKILNRSLIHSEHNDALKVMREEVIHLYPNNIRYQIKELIDRVIATDECNLDFIACSLNMHPRVLQNRLKKLNTSYSQLLKETRTEIAQQYLLNNAMNVTDLSLKLGYSEVAIFSRNYKEWTGLSPKQWQLKYQKEKFN